MFELTVKDSGKKKDLPCGSCSHAEIRIKDLSTDEIYIVSYTANYDKPGGGIELPNLIQGFKEGEEQARINECRWPICVTLYSHINKPLSQFIVDLEREFPKRYFDICTYNCSDAANYTLNYFFPVVENRKKECLWQAFKCSTFLCCLSTCGLFPCLGAPPSTYSPSDIIWKAKLLSRTHGQAENQPLLQPVDDHAPPAQKMQM